MGSELLTIKEIAGKLSLPESTLRKYRDLFIRYLPYVGSGRMKKYRPLAVEIFKKVRELRMDQHLSWRDIETEIAETYPSNTDRTDREKSEPSNSDNDEIIKYLQDEFEKSMSETGREMDRLEFVVTSVAQELIELRKVIAYNARETKEIHTLLKEKIAVYENPVTAGYPVNENIEGTPGQGVAIDNRQHASAARIARDEKGRKTPVTQQASIQAGEEVGQSKMKELHKEIIDARLQLAGYRKKNEALEQELHKLRNSQKSQAQSNSEKKGGEQREVEKGHGPDHYPANARKGKRFFGGNR